MPPRVSLYRRKLLLALVKELGGDCADHDFQERLACVTGGQDRASFNFVATSHGVHSFTVQVDRRALVRDGWLREGERWTLARTEDFRDHLTAGDRELLRTSATLPRPPLPTLAVDLPPALLSLGYEGKSLEAYLNQLLENGVQLLADVRKNPLSMKFGFSRKILRESLASVCIGYAHLPALGIDSAKRQRLETKADYRRLFADYRRSVLPKAADELAQLETWIAEYGRVAITCFEAHPACCHRSEVAKALAERSRGKLAVIQI